MKTVLLFFALMMVCFLSFGQESGYINLPNGCQIWMKDKSQKVEWTGPCTNGYASGVGTKKVFEDNKLVSIYEGSLVNGKREGKGKNTLHGYYQDEVYDGTWKNDERLGTGFIDDYYYSTYRIYVGEILQFRFHGKGKIYTAGPSLQKEGNFFQNVFIGNESLESYKKRTNAKINPKPSSIEEMGLIEIGEQEPFLTIDTQQDGLKCMVISKSGKLIATGDERGILKVWELASGKLLNTISVSPGSPISFIEISNDDQQIICQSDIARVCDVATGELSKLGSTYMSQHNKKLYEIHPDFNGGSTYFKAPIKDVVLSNDLKVIAVKMGYIFNQFDRKGGEPDTDTIVVMNEKKEILQKIYKLQHRVSAFKISPDNKSVLIAYRSRDYAELISLQTGKAIQKYDFMFWVPDILSFSNDSKYVSIGSSMRIEGVVVYEAISGKPLLSVPSVPPSNLTFTPDNQFLVANGSKYVRIWKTTAKATTLVASKIPEKNTGFEIPKSNSEEVEFWESFRKETAVSFPYLREVSFNINFTNTDYLKNLNNQIAERDSLLKVKNYFGALTVSQKFMTDLKAIFKGKTPPFSSDRGRYFYEEIATPEQKSSFFNWSWYNNEIKILADLYYKNNLLTEAITSNEEIYKNVELCQNCLFSKENRKVESLVWIGKIKLEQGKIQEAQSILEKAFEESKVLQSRLDDAYEFSRSELGNLYLKTGDYSKANALFDELITFGSSPLIGFYRVNAAKAKLALNQKVNLNDIVFESTYKYPTQSEERQQIMLSLVAIFRQQNKHVMADSLLRVLQKQALININEKTNFSTDIDLEETILKDAQVLDKINSEVIRRFRNQSFNNSILFDNALFLKSYGLQRTSQLRKNIAATGDSTLTKALDEYLKIQKILLGISEPSKRSSLIAALTKRGKILASRSGYFNEFRTLPSLTFKDIQKNLKPNEVAIEFTHFNYFNGNAWTDSTLYYASVIKKGDVMPKIIPLFEQKQLAKILEVYGDNDQASVTGIYQRGVVKKLNLEIGSNQAGSKLYELIWKPIENVLNGVQTIHYAPSGLLHKISFAALTLPDGKLLIDKYNLQSLLSTRALLKNSEVFKLSDNSFVALFGGINYDDNSEALKKSINKTQAINRNLSVSFRNNALFALPGTESEIKAISEILISGHVKSKMYSDYDANEEALKLLSSPSILHVATHGFFFSTPIKQKATSPEQNLFESQENAMLRSGLLLAGANRVWQGKPPIEGLEDGILTSFEVSQLNLINTQLVVLSACETGLGDVKGAEGVFGLQRAFKIAGAKHLIMSLWQVPDAPTAEMMKILYVNLAKGMDINMSFREAQKAMRQNPKYSVFDWAAFVLLR